MSKPLTRICQSFFLTLLLLTIATPTLAQAEAQLPANVTEIKVAGQPEAIGRAVGETYAQQIRAFHPLFLQLAARENRDEPAELYQQAQRFDQFIAEADRAEMRGVAAGAGLKYEDVLFLNTFYSLTQTAPIACRQIALWGDQTTTGQLLHGRNLDWRQYPGDPLGRNHLILRAAPESGHRFIQLTWPGMTSVLTGTNEHGISVAFNTLAPTGKKRQAAEPTFFTLKRVLRDCATLEEALELMRRSTPYDNGSVLISSAKERSAAVVEIIDGRIGVRRPLKSVDMIGNANHPTREAGLVARNYGAANAPICDAALALKGPFTPERVKQIMADPRVLNADNLMSLIFVPAENRMLLGVQGSPAAKGEFVEMPLFELQEQEPE